MVLSVTLALLVGLAVGSFLDTAVSRIAARRPLLAPRSRCDACGGALSALDLVPVLSYLLLWGRCRCCAAPISLRAPLVEAACGGLALMLWVLIWR